MAAAERHAKPVRCRDQVMRIDSTERETRHARPMLRRTEQAKARYLAHLASIVQSTAAKAGNTIIVKNVSTTIRTAVSKAVSTISSWFGGGKKK